MEKHYKIQLNSIVSIDFSLFVCYNFFVNRLKLGENNMKILNKNILEKNIEERINSDITQGKIAGASVCVIQNQKEIYRNFFGYSNCETKTLLTEKNLFRMASMTKPVTAVCIYILAEKNLLKISDPISKYLPSFKNLNVGFLNGGKVCAGEKAKKEITIEMILSHKSGIGSGALSDKQMLNMTKEDKYSLKTAVCYYENMLLDFQPGEYERYSPVVGFDILARIVEIVSGMTFSEFTKENIFEPLKMYDTTFVPSQQQWDRIVEMSDFDGKKSFNANMPKCIFSDFPATYTCGGAGMVSSLDDYVKFAQMLFKNGTYNGIRVLSKESVENIRTPKLPTNTTQIGEIWGSGVRVNKNGFYKNLPNGVFGWSGAYGTHFFVDVENKIVAVYMKNSRFDGGSGAITASNFEKDVYNALN